jgi:hypothetical protein
MEPQNEATQRLLQALTERRIVEGNYRVAQLKFSSIFSRGSRVAMRWRFQKCRITVFVNKIC